MMWIILTGAASFTVGFVIAGLLSANKVSAAQEIAARTTKASEELDLLKARIRAVQHNAKEVVKGERTYNVQTPNGRFGKFNLPEV